MSGRRPKAVGALILKNEKKRGVQGEAPEERGRRA
jgi:hypothetical protein